MLRCSTPARLTTHSWGWFERGWSSAAPWGICELLLRPACLRILLQCISLFKLCLFSLSLTLSCFHTTFLLPLASVSVVQLCSRLQTRVWCQRPWAHREIERGGGSSDASMITSCHIKTRKTHARLVWWIVAEGSAGPQNVYTLHSSVTCKNNPPHSRRSRDIQAVSMGWGMKCAFLFTASSQVSPPPLKQRFHNIQSTCSILLAGTVRTQNKLMILT